MMDRVLSSPWLLWPSRLLLGAVFLWAAMPKILDQAAFANSILLYGQAPEALIPFFATSLAGIELVTALALISGLWRKGAAISVTALLVLFIAALSVAYLQGRSIDCGCFTSELSAQKASAQRAHMVRRICEDLGMLVLSVNLLVRSFREGR